ncbi:acyltransferase [Arthrobacter sp. FW305-BF8]|uniref:acyltransferase family protein n=1 Tax=Arthrobacter sp. FW305-BF8 TaxID=2879617 RepID=UPI001F1A13E3|nr:acyltransferase family protein [Arthrobacter sp. FW305-BF8]UKA53481.1 acyltransferase [Arthrobacter sp. FW305-BF8]
MSVETISASPRRAAKAARLPAKTSFRPEIQGLRALAVLMVVAYHVWLGRVSGGVDVFLMVSAFLMTLQFTNKFYRERSMDLIRHWLHLFRRLLPASAVVIAATLLATLIFVPKTRWLGILEQGWASLLYFQNWLLKAEAVDYYAEDHSLASPFQHFWSLSIQGQIFVLWPLIFAAAALAAKGFGLRYRVLLTYLFSGIFVASLTYSVFYTYSDQAQAYFDTGARLWEFALGSLVALVLPGLDFLSRPVRVVLGWVGVLAMLACGLILQVQTAFPGFIALWPTLAAAAVIVAGQSGSRFGVDRILSSRLLMRLGDNSFALYLWHWPVLVIYLIASGKDHAGWLSGSVVVATSLVLAFLTTRFVEAPWRQWKWPDKRRRRGAIAIVAIAAVAAVPLAGWRYVLDEEDRVLAREALRNNPGSKALLPGYVDRADPDAGILPSAAKLSKDWANLGIRCTGDMAPGPGALENKCSQSKEIDRPAKKVLVIGNSHAQQWMGALKPIAQRNNWQLYSLLRGGCVYAPAGADVKPECAAFNREVDQYLDNRKPDAIFTVATAASPSSPEEKLNPGYEEMARAVTARGIDVIGIRDNPRFSYSMSNCVVTKGPQDPACNPPRQSAMPAQSPFSHLVGRIPGLTLLDMSDSICTPTACPGKIGNMFVYLDNNHLSASYAASMADELEKKLKAGTGW